MQFAVFIQNYGDGERAYYMYIQCQHLAYASTNIFNSSFPSEVTHIIYGFRKVYSTESAAVKLEVHLNKQESPGNLYSVLSKAFDILSLDVAYIEYYRNM